MQADAITRARGLMVGIAAGNLLGIVQEGWPRERITETFPDGVRDIAAAAGYPDDDDLAQAIIIAEAAEQGPLDPDDLGRRLWEWAETNGLGMGGLTGHVLELYGGDVPQFLGARGRDGESRELADRLLAAGRNDNRRPRNGTRGGGLAAPDAKPQARERNPRRGPDVPGHARREAPDTGTELSMPHAWKHALDEYRYPVDLRRFDGASRHPGWFQLNICPGDALQTTGFEARFRSQARHHEQAWAEVVFWKLYSGGQGIAAKRARELLDPRGPVSASELWSSCAAYIEQPDRATFSALRSKLFAKPVVSTVATFPAFICPEKFPMVDRQIARWVRENGEQHGYPGDIDQVPRAAITESHWPFVASWMAWCQSMAAKLTRRTGFFWRARDVEMAVFTAQRCGLELNPM